jgi:hypothetical protein
MKSSVEFSTCGVVSVFKDFQSLEHFGFYISKLGMFNLYFERKEMYIAFSSQFYD